MDFGKMGFVFHHWTCGGLQLSDPDEEQETIFFICLLSGETDRALLHPALL